MVVVTESIIFLLWCWVFTLVYYLIGRFNPTCIQTPGGYNFEEADMGIVDVFTLSWSTFSTVVSEADPLLNYHIIGSPASFLFRC